MAHIPTCIQLWVILRCCSRNTSSSRGHDAVKSNTPPTAAAAYSLAAAAATSTALAAAEEPDEVVRLKPLALEREEDVRRKGPRPVAAAKSLKSW